jgi:DMSO/TMAO reductase YedYZ heme-binding membrane subunit
MKRVIDVLIYVGGILLVAAIFGYVQNADLIAQLKIIKLTEWFALMALLFLYLTLLISPLYESTLQLPGREIFLHSRKALGITALMFACLHAYYAFFYSLQGFSGLSYLPVNYRAVLGLGFASLIILFLVAIVSLGPVKRYIGNNWKVLQKFTYIAGVFILIHSALIGSHFVNLNRAIPQLYFFAVFLLLFLETIRIREWLLTRRVKFSYIIWLLLLAVLLSAYYYLAFSHAHESFHVH